MRNLSRAVAAACLTAGLAVACSSNDAPEGERIGSTHEAYSFVGFDLSNAPVTGYTAFPSTSSQGEIAIVGRFDSNALDDIAILSLADRGWNTIPVAFSTGDGGFRATNTYAGWFPAAATQAIRYWLKGDFNGDKLDDILLAGALTWNTVPIAFSRGDGSFNVTNGYAPQAALLAADDGRRMVVLDVNGDHMDDLVFVGGPTADELWIGYSNGDGTFGLAKFSVPDFAAYVSQGGWPVVGDFNGDGRGDIALLSGSPSWNTIPVALSNGVSFDVTNYYAGDFPTWSRSSKRTPNKEYFTGDFNNDHKTDIALVGGVGWRSIPVAMSNGNGSFTITNEDVGDYGALAETAGNSVLLQDFDGDSRTDIALAGSPAGISIPVAFSLGNGSFRFSNVVNDASVQFDEWAKPEPGHFGPLSGRFRATEGADIVAIGHAAYATIPMAHATSSVGYRAGLRCGDRVCSATIESCSTCAADCGPCPRCGDGVCNGAETCTSCKTDCTSPCPCTKHTFTFCDVGGRTYTESECTEAAANADAYRDATGGGVAHYGPCTVYCGGAPTVGAWQCCSTPGSLHDAYFGYGCSLDEAQADAQSKNASCEDWADSQFCGF